MSDDNARHAAPGDGVTRNEFLRAGGAGALALGAGTALAACGSSSSSSATATPSSTLTPKHGGTIKIGVLGGGSSDTLSPLNALNNADWARIYNLYDELVSFDSALVPQFRLAEDITSNADATVWTIRLRSGITFHNGKDLTADDVIYTFQQITNPKAPGAGAGGLQAIDVAHMKKLDKLTVRVPYKTPFSTFVETLPTYNYHVIPVGFDPKHPVGTGPFKYQSFTPGEQSVFGRNPDYWVRGLPYADSLSVTDYQDETSLVNALLGGSANVIAPLSADVLGALQAGGATVSIYPTAEFLPFVMRTDQAPLNDVRVRQAMRLIVDRPEMLRLLFGGHGSVGNDVFAPADAAYDRSIPQREQDLEQARSLLKQAGREGMSIQLTTSDIAQGTIRAAEIFAQQASGASVTVNLRQVTSTEFFGSSWLHWLFSQDYWTYDPYYPQVGIATVPTGPFNETHFDNPRYNKLYAEGIATTDVAKRTEIAHEMQMIDYTEGGYIIPFFPPGIDAYAKGVHGIPSIKVGDGLPANNWDMKQIWFA
jgi:peptide/nickel transport system substrate-binding protein